MVDRLTGHVTQLALVEFDPFYSQASWFRDYVAYCGVSDDGEKLSAVVMQLGRKKPLLKKELGTASQEDMPDSQCDAPTWEKKPTRITFLPKHGEKPDVFDLRARLGCGAWLGGRVVGTEPWIAGIGNGLKSKSYCSGNGCARRPNIYHSINPSPLIFIEK